MNRVFKFGVASAMSLFLLASVPVAAAVDAPRKEPARERFNENAIGKLNYVTAKYEDTLVHIGRDYDVGFVEMRAANPHLDPWIPGSGAKVVVPTMHLLPDAVRESVVINLAEMRLYLYRSPYEAPLTFPIGIGRDGLRTPVGTTKVFSKRANPTWTPTARMREEDPTLPAVVPPGPDNPMGTHALYLGFETIRIHGTNKPYGIGRRVSSGCIRMFPEDISRFYDMVPVGAKVTVVDQPIKAGWINDKLYLEVHPTQEQAAIMEKEGAIPDYQLSERDLAYIMRVAGKDVEKLDWPAIRKVVKERRGYPIEIAEKANRRAEGEGLLEDETAENPAEPAPVAEAEAAVPSSQTPAPVISRQ